MSRAPFDGPAYERDLAVLGLPKRRRVTRGRWQTPPEPSWWDVERWRSFCRTIVQRIDDERNADRVEEIRQMRRTG